MATAGAMNRGQSARLPVQVTFTVFILIFNQPQTKISKVISMWVLPFSKSDVARTLSESLVRALQETENIILMEYPTTSLFFEPLAQMIILSCP